jgi:hypothetical protein
MKDQQLSPDKVKLFEKPIKLFSKISLFGDDKEVKILPKIDLRREKEQENDRLPES